MKHKTRHYVTLLLLLFTTFFLFKGTDILAISLDYNTTCIYETSTENYYCSTTLELPFIQEITNGSNTFFLLQTWTFGELLLNFLIVFIISISTVFIIIRFLYPAQRVQIEPRSMKS